MINFIYKPDPVKISCWLSVMFVGAIALGLGGCTNPTGSSTKKLQIVPTLMPITDFSTTIAGDRAIVSQLPPPTKLQKICLIGKSPQSTSPQKFQTININEQAALHRKDFMILSDLSNHWNGLK